MKIPEHTKKTLESGRVCAGCGGRLTGIETVDNSGNPTVWAGCKKCSVYSNGVSVKAFRIAQKLVIEDHERPYSYMNESEYKTYEEKEHFFSSQIRGMSGLVTRILFLSDEMEVFQNSDSKKKERGI